MGSPAFWLLLDSTKGRQEENEVGTVYSSSALLACQASMGWLCPLQEALLFSSRSHHRATVSSSATPSDLKLVTVHESSLLLVLDYRTLPHPFPLPTHTSVVPC